MDSNLVLRICKRTALALLLSLGVAGCSETTSENRSPTVSGDSSAFQAAAVRAGEIERANQAAEARALRGRAVD
jgi:hypothetical protein